MNVTTTTIPPAIAFNVREITDAEGVEVLAASPEEAVTAIYGDRLSRLLRDCFASEPDWTLFVATLRAGPHRGRDTRFETAEIVVTSQEARP